MWMTFVSGLQAVASASADDAAKAATEGDSTLPPDTIPNFEGKLPTTQELLEMLESMTDISDEEKTTLREDLLKNIRGIGEAADNGWTMEAMILLSLLSVVALIFGKYHVLPVKQ
ncbi:hypothetical protein WN55_08502 [Dufourea novaeangliae]|uniref:Uncharacterized protein n=1 Tax=Dufourea novaeangliae TaxID=178035 RepID=A0A154P7M5_DUFNO|nr:hypothetical protein WN55_08502 [Dufourea novaeangliae]